MESSNPTLKDKLFTHTFDQTDDMTLMGTVNKTGILFLLLMAGACFSWNQILPRMGFEGVTFNASPMPYMLVGGLGGFILALVISFKAHLAPRLAPLYALLEGIFLGAISSIFEAKYPGVVMQAMLGTFGTLAAMVVAFRSGWVQATEGLKLGVISAMGAIAVMYLLSFILGFFGVPMNFLHDSSPLSIGISFVIVIVASLNLVLDFDFIQKGVARRAPKHMEWYGAFALTVTLVWLYLEILRLLSKLRERR